MKTLAFIIAVIAAIIIFSFYDEEENPQENK